MVWNLFKTVGSAITEAAKYILPSYVSYVADFADMVFAGNGVLAAKYEDVQLAQLKLQYLIHQENLNDQSALAKFNQEKAKELQAFIEQAKNIRQDKNHEFQRWRVQQEKILQLEILNLNHQLQRELSAYQRQTSLKVVEEQKRLENSPIWLVAADILNSHEQDEFMPLRIFFAPPKLLFERLEIASSTAKDFPDIELTLAEGLRQFFRKYSTFNRPVEFLAGAWTSKSFHSEASIKALFSVLKSEPTLVLESEIDGDYLNFRIGYWGLNWAKYRYEPVISRLSYRDILSEAAKTRAQSWLKTREKLIALGENSEEVDKIYGGDNVKNLEIWQREEKCKQVGIDVKQLNLNYIINKQDFEELCQFLVIYHCIFAGLVLDEYFLVQYNLPAILPQLLTPLTDAIPNQVGKEDILEATILYYQTIYQGLEESRAGLFPDLLLDLAESLAYLSNKALAKQQIIKSMQSWLKLRNLPQFEELEQLIKVLFSELQLEDIDYIYKLNSCLSLVGEETKLSVQDACYQRGMKLYEAGDYEKSILNFNQALKLNYNWGQAYYNRGLAYGKLEQYQEAIEDYTQALQIEKNWAEVYNNRGNIYYKLGEYEKAIADYEQAIEFKKDFEVAAKNKAIASAVLEELKRQQKKEQENLASKIENFSCVQTLTGHSHSIHCLAISTDNKILASGSFDDTIKLWDLETGTLIHTLKGHTGDVEAIAISPNGKIIASGSDDNTIKLWDLETGQEINTLRGHSHFVYSLAFTPDGHILASGSRDQTIKLWDLKTQQEMTTLKGHSRTVRCLAFSLDGQVLVSGSFDETIKIWQVNTGQNLQTLIRDVSTIKAIVLSPDGHTIFSAGEQKMIKKWDFNTGQYLGNFEGHRNSIYSLAISQDGQTLVSGSGDNTIKIWQVSTGKEIGTLNGHSNTVFALVVSSDGKTLVSGSADHTIKIWRYQRT